MNTQEQTQVQDQVQAQQEEQQEQQERSIVDKTAEELGLKGELTASLEVTLPYSYTTGEAKTTLADVWPELQVVPAKPADAEASPAQPAAPAEEVTTPQEQAHPAKIRLNTGVSAAAQAVPASPKLRAPAQPRAEQRAERGNDAGAEQRPKKKPAAERQIVRPFSLKTWVAVNPQKLSTMVAQFITDGQNFTAEVPGVTPKNEREAFVLAGLVRLLNRQPATRWPLDQDPGLLTHKSEPVTVEVGKSLSTLVPGAGYDNVINRAKTMVEGEGFVNIALNSSTKAGFAMCPEASVQLRLPLFPNITFNSLGAVWLYLIRGSNVDNVVGYCHTDTRAIERFNTFDLRADNRMILMDAMWLVANANPEIKKALLDESLELRSFHTLDAPRYTLQRNSPLLAGGRSRWYLAAWKEIRRTLLQDDPDARPDLNVVTPEALERATQHATARKGTERADVKRERAQRQPVGRGLGNHPRLVQARKSA